MKKILLVLLVLSAAAFAATDIGKDFTLGPFVDFEGTVHRGFGDCYRGLSVGTDFGAELRYVPTDNFSVGIGARTGVAYDAYMKDSTRHDQTIVDEYVAWTGGFGITLYIGEWWYVGYSVTKYLDSFKHDTYLSTPESDIDLDTRDYDTDEWDYAFETGARTSEHWLIYARVTSNIIDSYTIDSSKYNVYVGFRYFI